MNHPARTLRLARSRHQLQSDRMLARYYALRGIEMEEAFKCPGRASDTKQLAEELPRLVEGLNVLEIACGTGYWTQFLAQRARSVTAVDINEELLALARAKKLPRERVSFLRHDAWELARLRGSFNAAVGLFWWSHIPQFRLRAFLTAVNRAVEPGSLVVFVDNLAQDCRRTPPVGVDSDGNSYQRRLLRSGEAFDIIKNYPSRRSIFDVLDGLGTDIRYHALECVWMVSYRTPTPSAH